MNRAGRKGVAVVANQNIAAQRVGIKVSAASLIEALGGNPNSGMCPCVAHEDGTPSLSVRESSNGKVLFHCFAGCSQDAVLTALKAMGLWSSNGKNYAPTPRWKKPDKKEDKPDFREILRAAAESDLKPTAYLRGRGITLVPDCASLISPGTALKVGLRRAYPHMVVPIVNAQGEPVGAQTTALTRDASEKVIGNKPARLTHGSVKGNYVALAAPRPDGALVVGEGVETVLSAMQITGLPGIAALSCWNLPKINPPVAAEFIIAADHDAPGIDGAKALAVNLKRNGSRVFKTTPKVSGEDWNDVLKRSIK